MTSQLSQLPRLFWDLNGKLPIKSVNRQCQTIQVSRITISVRRHQPKIQDWLVNQIMKSLFWTKYAYQKTAFTRTPTTSASVLWNHSDDIALPAPSGPMNTEKWTSSEVIQWLETLPDLKQYATSFAENEIDGEALLELTDQELKSDLGIAPLGHRKQFFRLIKKLGGKSEEAVPLALPASEKVTPVFTASATAAAAANAATLASTISSAIFQARRAADAATLASTISSAIFQARRAADAATAAAAAAAAAFAISSAIFHARRAADAAAKATSDGILGDISLIRPAKVNKIFKNLQEIPYIMGDWSEEEIGEWELLLRRGLFKPNGTLMTHASFGDQGTRCETKRRQVRKGQMKWLFMKDRNGSLPVDTLTNFISYLCV